MAANRISQAGVEVLNTGVDAKAYVSQETIDALIGIDANARVSSMGVDVLRTIEERSTTCVVSMMYVEVLRTIENAATRRRPLIMPN